MKDKFLTNIYLALPAALVVLGIYVWLGIGSVDAIKVDDVDFVKVIPYIFVLIAAVLGMNVLIVLILGLLLTGVVGMADGSFDLATWFGSISTGIQGMAELIIISMLAGGLLGVVRELGGISWILGVLTRKVRSRKGAEYSIAALVCFTNLCTANNTIAILTVGNMVRTISERFGVHPRKAASILDTFSCCVQGCIPYGIQLLLASGLASLSTAEIIPYLYYPFCLFFVAVLAIQFNIPRLRKI